MAIRNMVLKDEELIRKKSRDVVKFDARLHQLLDDMIDTMYEQNGVGLAGPQIGILRKVVVIDVGEGPIDVINGQILETDGAEEAYEGCLSCPGEYGLVERPTWIKVRYQDRNGEWIERECTGLLARCMCHELDHLDGILFLDKSSEIITAEQMQEMIDQQEEDEYGDTQVSEK